ncbi:MAG: HAMP domain-containing sensor histidine kinase, partial [Bdellovibrionota bacterium]
DSLAIQGRQTQLSQVLLNLFNNAYDAVQTLTDKWIKIKVADTDQWVEIWVTDSGPGISSEVVSKMFQPFFTTKGVGKGTGLGLSISKKIIETHGGTLNVEMESPNTCFRITLPKR